MAIKFCIIGAVLHWKSLERGPRGEAGKMGSCGGGSECVVKD